MRVVVGFFFYTPQRTKIADPRVSHACEAHGWFNFPPRVSMTIGSLEDDWGVLLSVTLFLVCVPLWCFFLTWLFFAAFPPPSSLTLASFLLYGAFNLPVPSSLPSQIKKAYCPPEVVEGNPVLDYCKHLLFAWSGEVIFELLLLLSLSSSASSVVDVVLSCCFWRSDVTALPQFHYTCWGRFQECSLRMSQIFSPPTLVEVRSVR